MFIVCVCVCVSFRPQCAQVICFALFSSCRTRREAETVTCRWKPKTIDSSTYSSKVRQRLPRKILEGNTAQLVSGETWFSFWLFTLLSLYFLSFARFFFGSSVTDFVLLFYSISSSKFSLGRVFLCPAGFSLGRLSRPAWCGWMRRGGVLLDCLQSKEVFFLIVLLFLVFSALGTVCVLRPRRRRWAIAQIFFRCAIFLSCFVFFSFCLVSVGEARRERRRKTIFREANKRKEAKIKKKNTKISTRPKKRNSTKTKTTTKQKKFVASGRVTIATVVGDALQDERQELVPGQDDYWVPNVAMEIAQSIAGSFRFPRFVSFHWVHGSDLRFST